jgi:predicted RND superfamily exporter protein
VSPPSRNGLTRRYIAFVLRRRTWVVAVVALLTALAAYSMSQMTLGDPFEGVLPVEEYAKYGELTEQFGTDQVYLVGIEDPEFLTVAGQERLRQAIGAVEALEGVGSVRSVLDAVHLEPGSPFPTPVRYVDEARSDPSRIPELRERLARDPFAGGLLVGRHGASIAVVVALKHNVMRAPLESQQLLIEALRCFQAVYPPERLHQAGLLVVSEQMLSQTEMAVRQTTPLVGLVLLVAVWILFGRLWPAALSVLVAVVAMVWTIGAVGLVVPEFNIALGLIPAVMLIIAVSDVVHLCSAYLLELEGGLSKEEAILEACSDVGRACLFTSLTTFVGFVGISFAPLPAMKILGWSLGMGVGIALLLAVTLAPVAFSFLPTPRSLQESPARRPQQGIDRALAAVHSLTVRRPWWIIGIFAVMVVGSVIGTAQITIETNFLERLDKDNVVRVDARWFGERFHGTNVIHVYVKAPTPEALADPVWLARVATWEEEIRDMPSVQRVSSVLGALAAIHRATPQGSGAPPGALPERREDLRFVMGLLQVGAGDELHGLVDPKEGRLRLLVAYGKSGMRDTAAAAERIEVLGRRNLPASDVRATSLQTLVGQFIDEVVTAQRGGLAITIAIITLLMILGLRSLRVGAGSMIPNLLPLAVVGACLGVFWDRVDSDCIILTFIALGIGVDDTIHFLSRFRLETSRGLSRFEAIERTFAFAGRGIVMTTIVLGFGFLPFLRSDYFLMQMFGWLLPLCFLVALLADVLLIPAMAQVGWLRFEAAESRGGVTVGHAPHDQ